MKRVIINEFEKLVSEDLNTLQKVFHSSLYDDVLREFFSKRDGFIRGGFLASKVDADTVRLAPGIGFFYDDSQVAPNPKYRPIILRDNLDLTVDAATTTRTDIIAVQPAYVVTQQAERYIKQGGVISVETVSKIIDSLLVYSKVEGTDGGGVPATPSGWLKVAEIAVDDSGIVEVVDVRPMLHYGVPSENIITIDSAGEIKATRQTAMYLMDSTAGNQTLVLPPASGNDGLIIAVKKIDNTANTVTIEGTVEGQVDPVIEYQYTGRSVLAHDGFWYWYS